MSIIRLMTQVPRKARMRIECAEGICIMRSDQASYIARGHAPGRDQMGKTERLIDELYAADAERADAIVFGRRTEVTRRGFLGGAGLAAVSAAVGGPIVYGALMPGGLIPAAFAQEAKKDAPAATPPAGPQKLDFPGKDSNLVVLGDKPLVAETPEHLLDDDTTPTP